LCLCVFVVLWLLFSLVKTVALIRAQLMSDFGTISIAHIGSLLAVALTEDEQHIISVGKDQMLRIWEIDSGHCLQAVQTQTQVVTALALSLDNHLAISGSADAKLRLWDIETGLRLRVLEGHTQEITAVALRPDGKRAISGSHDRTIRLWDVDAGACLQTIETQPSMITALAPVSDGHLIISGSDDAKLRIWDLETGRCLKTLQGHELEITSIALTPDRRQILSGSYDGTIRFWDLDSGQCLQTIQVQPRVATALAISSDGRRMILGCQDGTLQLRETMIRSYYETSLKFDHLIELGRRLLESGQFEKTIDIIDQCLDLLIAFRKEEEAIHLLDSILEYDPNHMRALGQLVNIYSRVDDDRNLIATLKRLVDAALGRGLNEEAIGALEQLANIEPDEPSHKRFLADLGGPPASPLTVPVEDLPAEAEELVDYSTPLNNLSSIMADDAAIKLIPGDIARKYKVLPLSLLGQTLLLAMADPTNIRALDEIRFMMGLDVEPVAVSEETIVEAIGKYYGSQPSPVMESIEAESLDQIDLDLAYEVIDVESSAEEIDLDNLEGSFTDILINMILVEALERNASEIHIEPYEGELCISLQIGGVLYDLMRPSVKARNAIVSHIKILSCLDIAERHLPQEGFMKIKAKLEGRSRELDFSVSTLPTVWGEKIVLRLLDKEDQPPASVPARLEAKTIRRHTDVSFPSRVVAGKRYNLRIQIVPAEMMLPTGEVNQIPLPHSHDVTIDLEVKKPAEPHEPPPPIRLMISVAAENFEIEGESRAEIIVPLSGKSEAALFSLRGEQLGPGRIMLDFSQDGRPVGSLDLFPEVIGEGQKETDEMAAGKGEVSLSIPSGTVPDVVLKVFEYRCGDQPGRLHFVLYSNNPGLKDLPVMDGDLGTQDLKSEVSTWVEGQLSALGTMARRLDTTAEETGRILRNIGYSLYEQLLPEALKNLCWTLRQRGVKSMLILSDEPHIPWELIKPYRVNFTTGEFEQEDKFWGETYALTHWLRGRPPVEQFSLNRVFAVAISAGTARASAGISGAVRDFISDSSEMAAQGSLDAVDEELAIIHSLKRDGIEINLLPARVGSLREAFENGGFDLLHLASHGAFGGIDAADASAVLMEDGPFSAAELSPRMAVAIRRSTPLIFFNACHSGRIGFSLTRLGSWGARFVELGCGGFVGTLWPVTDEAAVSFAREFYKILKEGKPIGEAVLGARLAVHRLYPDDPTWLAYCCFADPMATVKN
jgi:tetratricopeptide (TPR) repeat protein